jgi:hypothetical protein
MSDPQKLVPLLLLPFVIQPILIGVYAQKIQDRAGVIWGLLAFVLNIVIDAFFEWHMTASIILDAAAEVGTAIILSTMVILAILVLLGGGPQASAGQDSINLRRGLFRIWILISSIWIIYCLTVYLYGCHSGYACFFFSLGSRSPIYFDIGTWLIGIPALAFVIGLVACWIIDGFRRSSPQGSGEPAQGGSDAAAEVREAAERSELSNRGSAVT